MENQKVSKWVNLIGIIAGIFLMLQSMYFTYALFKSMISDGGAFSEMIGWAGVCVDIGKIVCLTYFLYFMSKSSMAGAIISLSFYLGCFGISMVASQSLDLNKANQIIQNTIIASDEYKLNKSTIEESQDEISRLRAEIEHNKNNIDTMIENDSKLISYLQSRESARKKDWLTTPAGSPRDGVDVWDSRINKHRAELRAKIEADIRTLEIQLEASKNNNITAKENLKSAGKNGAILTTEGIISFAKWIDKEDPESAMAKMYIFKNIFIELLGSLLIMLATNSSQFNFSIMTKIIKNIRKRYNEKNSKNQDAKIKTQSITRRKNYKLGQSIIKKVEKKSPKPQIQIGFKSSEIIKNIETIDSSSRNKNEKIPTPKIIVQNSTRYNNHDIYPENKIKIKKFTTKEKENIRKYLDLKEKKPKIGIKAVSEHLNISEYKAKSIFSTLKNLGVLESNGKFSKIAMDKDQYYKMLEL